MTTTLSHASPIPAFGKAPADRVQRTPHQWVDALVTIAVLAWFTAALAWMIGDSRGVPATPVAQHAAAKDLPAALPQASAKPGKSASAMMRLI
jgi:hypothetical protein